MIDVKMDKKCILSELENNQLNRKSEERHVGCVSVYDGLSDRFYQKKINYNLNVVTSFSIKCFG